MKKSNHDVVGDWDNHNRLQLWYFRSLSLRQKMEAVEGMADLARHFEKMRATGAFYPSPVLPPEPGR